MSLTKRVFLFAGAALSVGVAAQAQSSITDEARAQAAQTLADASGRTSALAPASAYTPKVGGYLQFRYNWNNADNGTAATGASAEDSSIGFQTARTRVNVSGNVYNDSISYFVQGGWGPSGEGFLEDAYGSFNFENGWWVTWGQTKLPILREELVGDTEQLLADRLAVNWVFSQGRSQGVIFGYKSEAVQFRGAFSDGVRTANTDYTGNEADWAFTGRVDWKIAGAWDQAKDFTSFRNQDFFALLGGALHYENGGDTFATGATGATMDTSILGATVDFGIEGNGWNGYAALVWLRMDPTGGIQTDDFGILLQGGVFVAPQVELIGRIDSVIPDGDRANDDAFTTIGGGVNYYISPDSHAAKLTADVQYFIDATNATGGAHIVPPSTLGGLNASADDGQWNVRVQMQLVF